MVRRDRRHCCCRAHRRRLLTVNAWGIWQFLLSRRKKREIELRQEIAERAQRLADRQETAEVSG